MDYSSILSSSEHNVSIHTPSGNNHGLFVKNLHWYHDNTVDLTSHCRVQLDNIDINLVNYLNRRLSDDLGFESVYKKSTTVTVDQTSQTVGSDNEQQPNCVDYNSLFVNLAELVNRYCAQLGTYDRLKEQYFQLDKENGLMLRRHENLKEAQDAACRERADLSEKCRQSQLKAACLTKSLKELTEENRKLQNTIEQRDKQFKHERKKLERDLEKLKERVQALSVGKTRELPSIDISEAIGKKTGVPRATWSTETSTNKRKLEMYTELIKDYDRKLKELIVETSDMRHFISGLYALLCDATSTANQTQLDTTVDITTPCGGAVYDSMDDQGADMSVSTSIDRLIHSASFDIIQADLHRVFRAKISTVQATAAAAAASSNPQSFNMTLPNENNESITSSVNRQAVWAQSTCKKDENSGLRANIQATTKGVYFGGDNEESPKRMYQLLQTESLGLNNLTLSIENNTKNQV